jgi:predicted peptidase
MRMALHASYGIRTRFKVDESRIYVSGFSGGARVASMLGVAWPDLFSGSVSFMGANFYTEIPSSNGKIFAPSFIPDDQALAMAKKDSRHVLVTAEKDFNRAEIFSVYENGYRKEKFRAVTLLEVPQLGHSIPDSSWLEKALLFLDGARH